MNINYLERIEKRKGSCQWARENEQKVYIKMYCTEKALKLLLYRLLLPFTSLFARVFCSWIRLRRQRKKKRSHIKAQNSNKTSKKLCVVNGKVSKNVDVYDKVVMLVWKICRRLKSWEIKERKKKTSAIYLPTLSDRRHFIVLSSNKHFLLFSFHLLKLSPFSLSFYELS